MRQCALGLRELGYYKSICAAIGTEEVMLDISTNAGSLPAVPVLEYISIHSRHLV